MARTTPADVRLGDRLHADGRLQACLAVEAFQCVLQGQTVEDGGQHSHVVCGPFLDDLAAGAELSTAKDVAAADNDGQLHAALDDAFCLPGNAQGLINTDAAFAWIAEPFAAQLQNDAAIL